MTHPIIPSADLILQWRTQWQNDNEEIEITNLIYQAARWGGDQELEACCDWLESNQCIDPEETVQRLYDERRANCLTIKEQALHALEVLVEEGLDKKSYDLLLDALEGLPD
jgi:hypothetical protein